MKRTAICAHITTPVQSTTMKKAEHATGSPTWLYNTVTFLFVETGSEEFNQFISLLGNRVRLKGWDKYRGGLDVKGEQTTAVPLIRTCFFFSFFILFCIYFRPLFTLFVALYTGDMTGEYSAYTIYEGHEIMFHVSTMLPYSKDNRQQVIRKYDNRMYATGGGGFAYPAVTRQSE